jgi:Protein of unknown function (DUF3307)
MLPFPAVPAEPEFVLLALLLGGHVLSDFLFQTHSIATAKRINGRVMLLHGLMTGLIQAIILAPLINLPLFYGVLLLSLSHLVVDAAKVRLSGRVGALFLFSADQVLHLGCIAAVWIWLKDQPSTFTALSAGEMNWLPEAAGALLIAASFVFLNKGGTAMVKAVLEQFPDVAIDAYPMGRIIGCLERYLLFLLVLLGQWGALGFVVAAKSIARFRELESQRFADYYLIGTLTSILIAVAMGIGMRWILLLRFNI